VRSALVVGSDSPVRYGLAREFEAYAEEEEDTSIAVFETLDEAMVWLGEGDTLDSPRSTTGGR
jgi:hypothetical protein